MSQGLDVFILGTGYCGSTMVGNALNAHAEMQFVGELNRLPAFKQFESEAYRGAPLFDRCAVCGTHERYDCPVWTDHLVKELSNSPAGRAADAFRRCRGGEGVVVDGSKNVRWIRHVLESRGRADDVRIIHCVRSPFAFAASYKKHTGGVAWMGGAMWRDTLFDVIRTAAHYGGIPILLLQYERFAFEPEPSLRRVCDFLGRPFDPAMLRFWEVPVHPLGGNYGAYVRYPNFVASNAPDKWKQSTKTYADKPFGGWRDERWLRDMSKAELTEVMFNPGLADAAGLAGYDLAYEMETFFLQRNGD